MAARARVLAYYLPQYHPIPENDEQWGKGFTEWTNVARATPMYPGHYQPHIPADLGFYDLRVEEVREAQSEMARECGIEAFLYYHYWFGGRRLLERPFDEVLSSGKPDFPFCLCWANHSWTGIWQGSPDKLLVEQVYPGLEDHRAHFEYLLRAFTDPRYLSVDGKPFFAVYSPGDIPDIRRVTDFWREMAHRAGLPGLHLVGVNQLRNWRPADDGFDASIAERLPPLKQRAWRLPGIEWYRRLTGKRLPSIYSYEKTLPFMIRRRGPDFENYPCLIPNWDNTPRSRENGLVLHGSTPELFRRHLKMALKRVESQPEQHRILILKAWNEWAEGNYVEPDLRFGRGYLEVLRQELLGPPA
jgi:lipopolysaccharide biosynthesis protein